MAIQSLLFSRTAKSMVGARLIRGSGISAIFHFFVLLLLLGGFFIAVSDTVEAAHEGDFTYTVNDYFAGYGIATITGYTGSGGAITIPSALGGRSNVAIGDRAFFSCTSLTSVTIEHSVLSIGNFAFSNCTSLTSVTIPDSVTKLGESAFSNCTSLVTVTIPDGVTRLGDSVFSNCISLVSAGIGSNVRSIGDGAFSSCSSLTYMTIPNRVSDIGDRAFFSCTSLISISLGSDMKSIGSYAFSQCASLTAIYFLERMAPTTGDLWIFGTDVDIRGHAYAASNFPVPGDVFNGLIMGEVLPDQPAQVFDPMPILMIVIVIIYLILVVYLIPDGRLP